MESCVTVERRGAQAGVRLSDTTLIERMLGGEDAAFEALFQRYRARVQQLVHRTLPARLTRRVSIADVLQEAHLTAWERRLTFEDRGPGSFRNWLLRIAQLKAKEAVRRHAGTAKRALAREVTQGERPRNGQVHGKGPTPSQVAVGLETAARARRVLEALPASYREILRLTRQEHRSLQEAAELTNRSYAATRKLVARALARFAAEYERMERDEA